MTHYHVDRADEYTLDPSLVVYQVDEWEGLMDKRTGHIITPAIYTNFEMISKDLIRATLSLYDEESVVMDRRGYVVKQE